MTSAYYTEDLTGRGENLFAFEREYNRELALASRTQKGWTVESSPMLPAGYKLDKFHAKVTVSTREQMEAEIARIAEAALVHLANVEKSLKAVA